MSSSVGTLGTSRVGWAQNKTSRSCTKTQNETHHSSRSPTVVMCMSASFLVSSSLPARQALGHLSSGLLPARRGCKIGLQRSLVGADRLPPPGARRATVDRRGEAAPWWGGGSGVEQEMSDLLQ